MNERVIQLRRRLTDAEADDSAYVRSLGDQMMEDYAQHRDLRVEVFGRRVVTAKPTSEDPGGSMLLVEIKIRPGDDRCQAGHNCCVASSVRGGHDHRNEVADCEWCSPVVDVGDKLLDWNLRSAGHLLDEVWEQRPVDETSTAQEIRNSVERAQHLLLVARDLTASSMRDRLSIVCMSEEEIDLRRGSLACSFKIAPTS